MSLCACVVMCACVRDTERERARERERRREREKEREREWKNERGRESGYFSGVSALPNVDGCVCVFVYVCVYV